MTHIKETFVLVKYIRIRVNHCTSKCSGTRRRAWT